MPDLQNLLLFIAAATLLAIMPGPGILYVAARSLAGGRAEGVASSLGTGVGGMVHVVAGAAGLSALMLASAELFGALKLIGAVYLLWLGVRTIMLARREATAAAENLLTDTTSAGARRAFIDGVLVEALNPKTAAFFLALLPQFVEVSHGNVAGQFVVLGLISVALNTGADLAVAALAALVRDRLAANLRLLQRLREASGGILIALGIGLLLVRRPASA